MTAFVDTATGAVSGTLSGGTDTISIPVYKFVEITNLDSSVTQFVATDSTVTPAQGTDGTIVVPPGQSVVVENPAWGTDATATARVINIKGASGTFAARGLAGWPR